MKIIELIILFLLAIQVAPTCSSTLSKTSSEATTSMEIVTGVENNNNNTMCGRIHTLPEECDCHNGITNKSVTIECLKHFNNTLFNDTIGIELKIEPCNPQGSSISLDITDTNYQIDYPISQIRAGEKQIIPIPGLSIIVPTIGHAGVDAVMLIEGNPDILQIQVGLDACIQLTHKFICAESIPGLTDIFPWWILNGVYHFGDYCETTTTTTTTTSTPSSVIQSSSSLIRTTNLKKNQHLSLRQENQLQS